MSSNIRLPKFKGIAASACAETNGETEFGYLLETSWSSKFITSANHVNWSGFAVSKFRWYSLKQATTGTIF